jgi:DNA-binding transcriptional LysR family regulator
MLRHSRLILNHIRQLQADLVLHGQGVRGQVHVLANISSMAEFLPDCIRTFAARYPQVAITLEERRSAEVVKGIEDGEADIGISRAFVPSQGLTCFPLRSDRFGVVVDAAHPLASAETIPFAMTLGYERIGLAAGQGQLPSLQAVMAREATEHGRDLVYRVRVSSYDVALRLLQGTPALSVMPMEVALPRVKALGLVVIPLKDAWATQHFTAFVRPDEQRAPAVDQLLRHLLDTLGTSAPAPQDS